MNSLSPSFALLMGWWLVYLMSSLASRSDWRRWGHLVYPALMFALLVYLAYPALRTYRTHVKNQARAWREEPILYDRLDSSKRAIVQLAGWLRRETEPTSGYFDASESPEYSILSAWTFGHWIRYEARRAVAIDNFGTNFMVGIDYARGNEKNAHEVLDRLRVRYVVVDPSLLAVAVPFGPYSTGPRLYWHDGSEHDAGKDWKVLIPALQRHRLVSEFVPLRGAAIRLKVFEYVRGVRLVGTASAGKLVHARLPLRTNTGRSIVYKATAKADGRGRYTFRLPYANRGSPPGVRVHPHYSLTCGSTSVWRVSVEEWQVQAGEEIAGPDMCR